MTGTAGAPVALVWPGLEHLASYVAALERGWSPDTLREEAAREELERIATNPRAFLAEQVDREAAGPPGDAPRRHDGGAPSRIPPVDLGR